MLCMERVLKDLNESVIKLATFKWFYVFLNKLSNIQIPFNTGDFRLMSKMLLNH